VVEARLHEISAPDRRPAANPGVLKLIGYWMEDLRESFCLPQELAGELPGDVREHVVRYLRAGAYGRGFGGFSWCRFSCGADQGVMGTKELTDGEWIWPEGLAHYVEVHGIILPAEFIERVLRLGSPLSAPDLQPDSASLESMISLDYWLAWCAQHRSGPWQERIRKARMDCDKTAASALRQSINSKIGRFGLANYECSVLGCGQKARFAMKFCGEHCLTDYDYEVITRGCYPVSAAVAPEFGVNPGVLSQNDL